MEITDVLTDTPSPGLTTVVYENGTREVFDKAGNKVKTGATGTTGTTAKGDGSIWSSILGAIPGILTALFPSGAVGGSNNTPVVYTPTPAGNTGTLGGSNILLIGLVLLGGLFLMNGQTIKPKRKR